jgi:hypothetical protein
MATDQKELRICLLVFVDITAHFLVLCFMGSMKIQSGREKNVPLGKYTQQKI